MNQQRLKNDSNKEYDEEITRIEGAKNHCKVSVGEKKVYCRTIKRADTTGWKVSNF